MINGLGFLVWRLARVLPLDVTIEKLHQVNAKWVSIKFLDGKVRHNLIDPSGNLVGNDTFLIQAIQAFRDAGIAVGGWHFLYTPDMVGQARLAISVINEYGLDHWLIDAESVSGLVNWEVSGTDGLARVYMNNLLLPSDFPLAICSYRFPNYFPSFPMKAFVNHPRNNFIASQMYWMQAHNPRQQLIHSIDQYNAIRGLPHTPIGAAFRESGWEPTVSEIHEFVQAAIDLGCPGYGFWDLDEAIYRHEWLEAMVVDGPTPPPPPPPPEPVEVVAKIMKVATETLRVRNSIIPSNKYGPVPGTHYNQYSRVWFNLSFGQRVEVLEEVLDGRNIWVRIGQKQYCAKLYDDGTYLV